MDDASRAMLDKLEDLVIGSGGEAFQALEGDLKYFCPFEAVGMARHEIRHSNFLAYILDPSRPHGFSDALLQELVFELLERPETKAPIRKLDLYFRPLGGARVYRERMHMDLLIEIPGGKGEPGLVVAIEVKVNADEGHNQLQTYAEKLQTAYPISRWTHLYGFLTISGRPPGSAGEDAWAPLSFTDLIERFSQAIRKHGFAGPAVDHYEAYVRMMRRNRMVEGEHNQKLKDAAQNLWLRHREALEYLIANRPTLCNDAMLAFDKALPECADYMSKAVEEEIRADTSNQYRRFSFAALMHMAPDLGQGGKEWVASGCVAVMEVFPENDQICAWIVAGPAPGAPAFRSRLVKLLKPYAIRAYRSERRHHAYWRATLLTQEDLVDHAGDEGALADLIRQKSVDYLKRLYPDFRRIVMEAAEATPKNSV